MKEGQFKEMCEGEWRFGRSAVKFSTATSSVCGVPLQTSVLKVLEHVAIGRECGR